MKRLARTRATDRNAVGKYGVVRMGTEKTEGNGTMERQEKFTPGPWRRAKNKSRGGSGKTRGLSISRIVDPNGVAVAFAMPRRQQVANLQLIAAAPEMFEALKDSFAVICDLVDAIQNYDVVPDNYIAEAQDHLEEIKPILEKARGNDVPECAGKNTIWHDHEDIPNDFNNDVIAVTINGTWFKMPVSDLQAFLSSQYRPMIRKWSYIRDLEKL